MRRERDGAAGGGVLIYVRDGIGISRIKNRRILRIFILQISSDLSVFTKDVFDILFVNGPGLTSTFPIISVK
jgi:hypothetical protein